MDKTPTNIVHGHATEVQGDALETKCTRFECLLMTTKEKENIREYVVSGKHQL